MKYYNTKRVKRYVWLMYILWVVASILLWKFARIIDRSGDPLAAKAAGSSDFMIGFVAGIVYQIILSFWILRRPNGYLFLFQKDLGIVKGAIWTCVLLVTPVFVSMCIAYFGNGNPIIANFSAVLGAYAYLGLRMLLCDTSSLAN